MKKTKLLIVVALAVLATLAMSACGLIVNSVSDIEFTKMPKTYYSTTDIETNGITIELNVKTNSGDKTIAWTIKNGELEKEVEAGLTLVATGFETGMGEHTLTVSDENETVVIEAQYRVCELLNGANANVAGETIGDELKAVLTEKTSETGFYMLAGNAYVDRIEVSRPFVLYGENYAVIKNATVNEGEYRTKTGTESRVMNIQGDADDKSYLDGGLFELNNVGIKNESSMKLVRGISVYNVNNATINFNACDITSDWYAINIASLTDNLTVNISNGTWSTGWAAVNTWCSNSVINIDSTTMIGVNTTISGDSNTFATVVVNAYDSNVLNITNSHIVAISNEGTTKSSRYGWQDHIRVQNDDGNVAEYNVINLVNCTYSTDGINKMAVTGVDRENGFRFYNLTGSNSNIITIK